MSEQTAPRPWIWGGLCWTGLLDACDETRDGKVTLSVSQGLGNGPAWYRIRTVNALRSALMARLVRHPTAHSGLLLAWQDPAYAAAVELTVVPLGRTVAGLDAEAAEVTLGLGALLGVPEATAADLAELRAMFQAIFDQGIQAASGAPHLWFHRTASGPAVIWKGVTGEMDPALQAVVTAHPIRQAWLAAQFRGLTHRHAVGTLGVEALGGRRRMPEGALLGDPTGFHTPSPPPP